MRSVPDSGSENCRAISRMFAVSLRMIRARSTICVPAPVRVI